LKQPTAAKIQADKAVCLFLLIINILLNNISNKYTLVHKNVPLLFFEQLRERLTDLNNFWHATSEKNLTQQTVVLATLLNTVATLPCEMQKS